MTKKCKNTQKIARNLGGFYPDSGFFKNVLGLFCITFLSSFYDCRQINSLPGMDRRVPTRRGQVAGERYVIKRF